MDGFNSQATWRLLLTNKDVVMLQELSDDHIIQSHVAEMYDSMLRSNLLRVVEPFSRVELDHVAELVNLPRVGARRVAV